MDGCLQRDKSKPAIEGRVPIIVIGWLLFCFFIFQNCTREKIEEPAEFRNATDVTLAWNQLLLDLERYTPGYRPPVSARTFAYIEMAAYEVSLPALDDYVSLEYFCPGYQSPAVNFSSTQYYLPAGLNAAYSQSLRNFFPNAPKKWFQKIEHLEADFTRDFQKQMDSQTLENSKAFGLAVAKTVWDWSATDREGHNGFLFNFDKNYVPPVCPGCWQSDAEHPMPALLPNWGKVRGFVVQPGDLELTPPVPFDEQPGSAFHTEAMEVFSVSQPLSRENRWIAELWSDDHPGLTVTPAGRWIAIANQAVAQERLAFSVVIETYLKTSLALCDASIAVWHSKYQFNIERPEAYIRRNIKPDWTPLHENPSFPSYPSGHAAFGAAAAEVLSATLGDQTQFTDRTHENRREFAGAPRTYSSFSEMAKENAASRVLIGVHYRMDCEEGLRLGKIIGQKVAALPLRRKEAVMIKAQ
jgi:hypothetical protein